MKSVSLFVAVLALMAALSPSGSEARHWGICKGALNRAWGACWDDASSAECCSAAGDVAEQCPHYFSFGWVGRVNARCSAKKTPPPALTPPSASGSHPRMSCKRTEVLIGCIKEIGDFNWHGATTMSDGCCKSIVHLIDQCHTNYDFSSVDYWNKCHAYCLAHH